MEKNLKCLRGETEVCLEAGKIVFFLPRLFSVEGFPFCFLGAILIGQRVHRVEILKPMQRVL